MPDKSEYVKLFEPGSIGRLKIRNRIVMPPMATNYAAADGKVTDLMIAHYEQRAAGGVGLIITEGTCPDFPVGKGWPNEAGIDDDKYIPGFKRLVDAVHKHGAKIAMQLHHAGREARQQFTGKQPVAPSSIPASGTADVPRELTVDEIKALVNCFAIAAARARKCGFDGVEIHGAHGYLIHQFLSLRSNKRTDSYGGDLANRSRFLLEVIGAVRSKVGADYPVWCRINAEEMGPKSISSEDLPAIAKMAEKAGCDAVHVSVYGLRTMTDVAGELLPYAESVKKAVGVPVIAVGFMSPEVGNMALLEGKADFIAMGRRLLCDAEIPNKLMEGRPEDIVPCIQCLQCEWKVHTAEGIQCSVNATLGSEYKYPLARASKAKKILVVGGGPAGMEAARVAALRGHDVTLYDSGSKLGGQLLLAGMPPDKQQIKHLVDYLSTQMRKLNIKVEQKAATAELIQKMDPDAVIVATGAASPLIPDIPGLDKIKSLSVAEVLSGRSQIGKRVVVIGGGLVGCETAEFLAAQGKEVTIIEVLPQILANKPPLLQIKTLLSITGRGIVIKTGATCEKVSTEGVTICTPDGTSQTIPADTVVIATGSKTDRRLYDALQGKVGRIILVGDAVEPRSIFEAVADGFKASMSL
jgi:2,4-dienoyl-CoA reductase-like NADH-dependent reductase (Old Yellow Enzyme family)/thioredoxin reductase